MWREIRGTAAPAGLYVYAENVDKVVAKATSLGATGQGPVMDMFWGDRCGSLVSSGKWFAGAASHSGSVLTKFVDRIVVDPEKVEVLISKRRLRPCSSQRGCQI